MVTIDQWGISLRLDSSDFSKDYADASSQVTQAMSKLNRETRLQKIQMDIDMSRFDAADKSIAAFGTRVTNLNKLLELQKNKVDLVKTALEGTRREYADTSSKVKQAEGLYAKEQKALADLERQLRQTTKAQKEAADAKWKKFGDAAGKAYDGAGAAIAGVAVISTKAAIDAVESESLFETSFGNMASKAREWSVGLRQELGLNEYALRRQAGTFYVMLNSMGLATPEAYKLSTGLTQLAQDVSSFYNLSTEEAFVKLRSGLVGETEPLRALGILVDEDTVKRTAWLKGIAEQGAELTQQQKIMARYATIMEQTSKAQGDLARTADSPANQIRRLRAEAEMLEVEIGNKLLPALTKLMGGFRDVVDAFNGLSNADKDGLLNIVKVGAEIGIVNTSLAGMAWALGLPLPGWVKLAAAIGVATMSMGDFSQQGRQTKDTINDLIVTMKAFSNHPELLAFGFAGKLRYDQAVEEAQGQVDEQKRLREAIKESLKEAGKIELDPKLKNRQTEISTEAEARAKAVEVAKAAAKAQEDLDKAVYNAKHTALESEIRDIEEKAKALGKASGDEAKAVELAELEKSKAIERFENDTMSKVNSIHKSALQNRLDEIDREKKAFQQKGVSEVESVRWAEEQKKQALQDAAVNAIKNNREYLDLLRGAQKGFAVNETTLPGGGKIYDVFKGQTAVRDLILQKEREKLGIKPGESFSAELIKEYEDTMRWVKSNLVPGLGEVGAQARTALVGEGGVLELNIAGNASQQIELIRGQAVSLVDTFGQAGQDAATRFYAPFRDQMTDIVGRIDASASPAARGGVVNNVSPTINVNIDRPQVRDEADISKIADQVADKITSAIDQKLGGGSNSY